MNVTGGQAEVVETCLLAVACKLLESFEGFLLMMELLLLFLLL